MRPILLSYREFVWNAEQRLQGHHDLPLTARGNEQAKAIKQYAQALAPPQAVSSHHGRCRETARLLGLQDAPTDRRLREIDMGEWSGRTKPELVAECPEDYRSWRARLYRPANGESWDEFCDRVA